MSESADATTFLGVYIPIKSLSKFRKTRKAKHTKEPLYDSTNGEFISNIDVLEETAAHTYTLGKTVVTIEADDEGQYSDSYHGLGWDLADALQKLLDAPQSFWYHEDCSEERYDKTDGYVVGVELSNADGDCSDPYVTWNASTVNLATATKTLAAIKAKCEKLGIKYTASGIITTLSAGG